MRKWISLLLCAAMLGVIFTGCGTSQEKQTDVVGSGVENLTAGLAPDIVPVQSADGTAVMDFGLELLRQSADGENVALSPLSAYLALALAANGAQGQTRGQFEQLLGCDLAELNNLAYGLSEQLAQTGGNTTVQIANSAWIQSGFPADESFLQTVVDYYNAEIFSADLPTQQTVNAINAWVKEKTNGEIPNILEQAPDSNAAILLLNALYFDGKWETPFLTNDTQSGSFYTSNGQTVSCEFMTDGENRRVYFSEPDFDGVVLPYDCGRYAMIAIRPIAGQNVEDLLQTLDTEQLQAALDAATEQRIVLQIPRFRFEVTSNLNQMLQNMGLVDAFSDGGADFSALTSDPNYQTYISQVVQKVKIEVKENGTRAAAVTEIELDAKSAAPVEDLQVCFDHPFLYAIIDVETQTPLFMGIVANPAQ